MLKHSEIKSVDHRDADVEIRVPSPSVKALHLCLRNDGYGGPGQPTRQGTHFMKENFSQLMFSGCRCIWVKQ